MWTRILGLVNRRVPDKFSPVGAGLFAAALLILPGCSTPQKTQSPAISESKKISADLFVDEGADSFKLKSELVVVNPMALRLDIFTTLDLPLATIALTDADIKYALYREKKFYQGKVNPHALDPVFPLSVNSRELVALLSEKPSEGQRCERDASGALQRCRGQKPVNYEIEWSKRATTGPMAGHATKIVLKIPDRRVELKFYLKTIEENIKDASRYLEIAVPGEFKLLPVPTR